MIIKDQSTQLTQDSVLIQRKLDKILDENEQIILNSASIFLKPQINTETHQIKAPQSHTTLQISNISSQVNSPLKANPEQLNSIIAEVDPFLLLEKIRQ